MRSRRVLRLALATSLVGIVACSAIAGLDGDFDDKFVDNSSSGSTSSGSDANQSSDQKSSTDSPIVGDDDDGGVDSGKDTGVPDVDTFDANPPTGYNFSSSQQAWCPTQVETAMLHRQFCYDFDALDAAHPDYVFWQQVMPTDGSGLGVIDSGVGFQGVKALLDSTRSPFLRTRYGSTNEVPAQLTNGKGYLLRFRFRVVSVGQPALIAGLDFHGQQYGLMVNPQACGPSLDCLGESTTTPAADLSVPVAFVKGTWYDASLKVTRSDVNGFETELTVGDRTLAKRKNAFPTTQGSAPDKFGRVVIGAVGTSGPGGTEVGIDELVVWRFPDATP